MSAFIFLQRIYADDPEIRGGRDLSVVGFWGWLGLIDVDTQEGFKQAYRNIMLRYHPDRNQHMIEKANEICKALTVFFKSYATRNNYTI